MSILLALVTFLLFVTITYLRSTRAQPAATAEAVPAALPVAPMVNVRGFNVPKEYSFHPGHTWAASEDNRRARVGMDDFAANLIGKVDRVDVPSLNRWVRQGQKVCKVTAGDTEVELVSPVEGIVVSVNEKLRDDPSLATREPYSEGWLFSVQSPDLEVNRKNLLQGNLVQAWMHDSVEHACAMATGFEPALAQDGGVPVSGLLTKVDADLRHQMISEFFLS